MRANARSYLHVYVKRGLVKKGPCEVCGTKKVQGHHDDYSKPLQVRWLCKDHHEELHRNSKGLPKQQNTRQAPQSDTTSKDKNDVSTQAAG